MTGGLTNALRGIGGEFEIQRILGTLGTVVYTLITPAFVALRVIENVSLTEFAIGYPAGLAACIGATAGSIALKDRQVAAAKATEAKTKSDAAGDGTQAIEQAEHEAATRVAGAATDEKDKITGERP